MRVLYIDIDSLRADHLGCYGYPRNTIPNIDRLADSIDTVLGGGGSLHSREGGLPYLCRLQATGREPLAKRLAEKHNVPLKGNPAS
jgi:hypothetical protein